MTKEELKAALAEAKALKRLVDDRIAELEQQIASGAIEEAARAAGYID